MWKDASEVVMECPRCRQFGPRLINFLLQPIYRTKPFDMVALDYLKLPLGKGGYREALVAVDYFTRWIWGFMLRKTGNSATTAECLRMICESYCPPRILLTDGGSHFKGRDVEVVCEEFGIEHQTTPAYAAHTNGLVEMENKLLLSVLSKLCVSDVPNNQGRVSAGWPTVFSKAINLINNRVTPILGTSPRAVMFGTCSDQINHGILEDLDPDCALRFAFLDLGRESAEETLKKTQHFRKEMFDKRAKPQTFQPGDTVLIHNSSLGSSKESRFKLSARWFGPFIIHSRHHNSYTVKTLAGRIAAGRIHAVRLKKFVLNPEQGFSRLQLQEVERLADEITRDDSNEDSNQPEEPASVPLPAQPPNQISQPNENITAHIPNSASPYPNNHTTTGNVERRSETDLVEVGENIAIPVAQRRIRRRAAERHKVVSLRPSESEPPGERTEEEERTGEEALEGIRKIFGG